MKEKLGLAVIGILIVVGVYLLAKDFSPQTKPTETIKPMANQATTPNPSPVSPIPMTIDSTKHYEATLDTTQGKIVVELSADKTPITVNNFVSLANKGFYNNTIFHRVIKGFMIQGGDPEGTGRGGPGYQFDDEPFDGQYTRGTIAMANAGPNTNGSQFFIMHQDYALPRDYVIFGKVTEGLETVDKIATAPTKDNSATGEPGSTPVSPVTIKTVTIREY